MRRPEGRNKAHVSLGRQYLALFWSRTCHSATASVARSVEGTGLLENPPAVPRPGDQCRYCDVRQFCHAYWENGLKELPTSQATQSEQKPIDIELTVQGQPAQNGFEAQSCNGRPCTVVHSADGWKVHGPFIDGESLRILNTRLAENGDILELMPWTEVFHR